MVQIWVDSHYNSVKTGFEHTGFGLRATCSFWTTFVVTFVKTFVVTFVIIFVVIGLQWRNWLAHGTYKTVRGRCRGCEFEPRLEQPLWFFPLRWNISEDFSFSFSAALVTQLDSALRYDGLKHIAFFVAGRANCRIPVFECEYRIRMDTIPKGGIRQLRWVLGDSGAFGNVLLLVITSICQKIILFYSIFFLVVFMIYEHHSEKRMMNENQISIRKYSNGYRQMEGT